MVSTALKNALFRKIVRYEESKLRCPQGRKRKASLAYLLDRILYICRTGCQWINLPVENVSPKTVFRHFNVWSRACLFEGAFYEEVAVKTRKSHLLVADTSFVKNVYGREVLGRNPTDRARRATKVSLLTDGCGLPVAVSFHQANRADCKTLPHLLATAKRKVPNILVKFSAIAADKGYDSEECRQTCRSSGLDPIITKRGNRDSAKQRYVVERTFGILDQFRRIKLRYEAKIHTFKSFHFVALLSILLPR